MNPGSVFVPPISNIRPGISKFPLKKISGRLLFGTSFFLFTLVVLSPCLAQKSLIKFGKVDIEDLKMKSYDRDSSARAAVLYDRGYLDGVTTVFTRHRRVKVFTSAGTSQANFTIQTPSKSDISGYTYNLENGEVVRTKLENSNIFKETIINGIDVYKLFFPNVKPGSIIDLEYSHFGLPREWRFQDHIPVVYNELILQNTDVIHFKKTFYGFEQVQQVRDNHWAIQNVPPIANEAFMNDYTNYLTRFHFDISKIKINATTVNYELSTTWEKISERLMKSDAFGDVVKSSPMLNDKGKELEKSNLTVPEKIDEAFRYIRENIKWNKSYSVAVTYFYKENFKKNHTGNSAEVNLLLVALLKKAGINVYPVILSTRDNGMLNPASASASSVNHVIAYVKHEGVTMLLDATSPHAVPGVLPEQSLNMSGWLVDDTPGGGLWIDLTPARGNVTRQFIRITPNENNEFIADVSNTHEGYAFLDWIEKFDKEGSAEAYAKVFKAANNLDASETYMLKTVDRAKLKGTENFTCNISATDHVQDIGREVLINPFVFNNFENPFKSDVRRFPIDFIYPRTRSTVISLTIPKGYDVLALPAPANLATDDGSIKLNFICNAAGNIINVRCDFIIAKPIFSELNYEEVRHFFHEAVKKMNESIQLSKKT